MAYDRFEEIAAEINGQPSPEAERSGELKKLSLSQLVDQIKDKIGSVEDIKPKPKYNKKTAWK